MLCEHCKSREATFPRVVVVNGKRGETHLCAECLQQSQQANMPEIMASFFTPAMRSAYQCARCSSTLSGFQQTGRLGCADCYDTFSDAMLSILRRIHGATQHVGRTPGLTPEATSVPTPTPALSEAQQLRHEIREAVASEDYERAALLRDRVRDLEAGGKVNESK